MKTLSHYNKIWCRVIAFMTTVWVFAASDTTTPNLQKNDEICNFKGDLYELDGTFQCWCETGYIGTFCDTYELCSPSPCVEGRCYDDRNGGFRCYCNRGYIGTLCDEDNPCYPSPCKYGWCNKNVSGGVYCTCYSGFTGELCDKDVDECASQPCFNGNCTDHVNQYNCTCASGYEGVNCENNTDECSSNPCLHGTCVDGVNGYNCTCEDEFTGVRCDEFITTTTEPTTIITEVAIEEIQTTDSSENAQWWGIGVASGVAMTAVAYASVRGIQYLVSKSRPTPSHMKTPHLQNMRHRTNKSTKKGDNGEDGNKDGDDISLRSMPSSGSKVFLMGRYTDFITTEVTIRDSIYVKRHDETLGNVKPARRLWCPIVEPLI